MDEDTKFAFQKLTRILMERNFKTSINHLNFALFHVELAENLVKRNLHSNYDAVKVCLRQLIAVLESSPQNPSEYE